MDIVNLSRNQEVLQGGQIQNSLDMHTVLDWGSSHGYIGHINLDNNGSWTMGLTAPGGNTSQSGTIGDWVVLKNNATITLVPAAQAPALYSLA